jgi:nucleoside-diphosphate-sugar epimerase
MKVLVTGGTGFIGGRVVESLLQAGHQVTYTGRSLPKDDRLKIAKFLRGDLSDAKFSDLATRDAEAIVHCAGMAGTWGDYQLYYQANVRATELLVNSAKQNGVRRVVNLSSPSIYFAFKDQWDLKEQDRPAQFSNAYAETKFLAEQLLQSHNSRDLQTVSLRPRSVIGRGDQNVLPRLIRLQQTGGLVQVGDGQNMVDITSIQNLLHAVRLCLSAGDEAMGRVYNITNGQPTRFWGFVEQVLTAAELPVKRRKIPYLPVMAAAKVNEIFSRAIGRKTEPVLLPISIGILSFTMTLDISQARRYLGYAPHASTQDGIDEFFAASAQRSQSVLQL